MSPTGDASHLSVLLELGQVLTTLDTRAALPRVLDVLAEEFSATGGTITLADEQGTGMRIEAAHGVSREAAERARYRPGEGITGRVVQSGKAIVVPRVSQEPLFLDKTGLYRARRRQRQELSFVSVPIPLDGRPAGALSAPNVAGMFRFRVSASKLRRSGSTLAATVTFKPSTGVAARRLTFRLVRCPRRSGAPPFAG